MVAGDQELFERLHFVQNATGGVMGPFESFLCGRGLKTLELAPREQSRTAPLLAEYLRKHPRVSRVNFPGLTSHAGHAVAARQMDGAFGAMLSYEVRGGMAEAKRVCESTKLFQLAVSLGSVESLIEQPATMSHAELRRGGPSSERNNGWADSCKRGSGGV